MLNIRIICSGAVKEKYFKDAIDEYIKRLRPMCKLEICEVSEDKYMSSLGKKAYKIALCIEGKKLTSEELSELIGKTQVNGYSEIDFVIGAAEGMSESVKAACDLRLSFSDMTFPYQLVRVILCEQIYRAFTILNNIKYHK